MQAKKTTKLFSPMCLTTILRDILGYTYVKGIRKLEENIMVKLGRVSM